MITLTNLRRGELDYDDEVTVNPEHIKTLRRVNVKDANDELVPVTEIEVGLIIHGEDGTISSEPLYVVEDVREIVMQCREWARSLRN